MYTPAAKTPVCVNSAPASATWLEAATTNAVPAKSAPASITVLESEGWRDNVVTLDCGAPRQFGGSFGDPSKRERCWEEASTTDLQESVSSSMPGEVHRSSATSQTEMDDSSPSQDSRRSAELEVGNDTPVVPSLKLASLHNLLGACHDSQTRKETFGQSTGYASPTSSFPSSRCSSSSPERRRSSMEQLATAKVDANIETRSPRRTRVPENTPRTPFRTALVSNSDVSHAAVDNEEGEDIQMVNANTPRVHVVNTPRVPFRTALTTQKADPAPQKEVSGLGQICSIQELMARTKFQSARRSDAEADDKLAAEPQQKDEPQQKEGEPIEEPSPEPLAQEQPTAEKTKLVEAAQQTIATEGWLLSTTTLVKNQPAEDKKPSKAKSGEERTPAAAARVKLTAQPTQKPKVPLLKLAAREATEVGPAEERNANAKSTNAFPQVGSQLCAVNGATFVSRGKEYYKEGDVGCVVRASQQDMTILWQRTGLRSFFEIGCHPWTKFFVEVGVYVISGAAGKGSSCNGRYTVIGTHNGRPLFKTSQTGAIIFWNHFWMINFKHATNGWLYAVADSDGMAPPTRQWTTYGYPEGDAGSGCLVRAEQDVPIGSGAASTKGGSLSPTIPASIKSSTPVTTNHPSSPNKISSNKIPSSAATASKNNSPKTSSVLPKANNGVMDHRSVGRTSVEDTFMHSFIPKAGIGSSVTSSKSNSPMGSLARAKVNNGAMARNSIGTNAEEETLNNSIHSFDPKAADVRAANGRINLLPSNTPVFNRDVPRASTLRNKDLLNSEEEPERFFIGDGEEALTARSSILSVGQFGDSNRLSLSHWMRADDKATLSMTQAVRKENAMTADEDLIIAPKVGALGAIRELRPSGEFQDWMEKPSM